MRSANGPVSRCVDGGSVQNVCCLLSALTLNVWMCWSRLDVCEGPEEEEEQE